MHTEPYVTASYYFTTSILWPVESHTDKEVRTTLKDLDHYFNRSLNRKAAFSQLIARVIAVRANIQKIIFIHPRVWTKPLGMADFITDVNDYKVKKLRRTHDHFDEMVDIIATSYLDYLDNPSPSIFMACNDTLEAIGMKKWMGVFYDALQHRPHKYHRA